LIGFANIREVVLSDSLLLQFKMESRVIVCFLLFAAMFAICLTAMPVDKDIPVTPQQFDEGRQFQVFHLKFGDSRAF